MRLVPVASDGWRFIIPLFLLGSLLQISSNWIGNAFGIILILGALFCVYFFRDPERKTVADESLIYSPGDGRILDVTPLTNGPRAGWMEIRIFLSVLDGHIQRSPIQGRVNKISYNKGRFLDARDPEAHLKNERNEVILKSPKGELVVTQIAGMIARRIVCWIKEGTELSQGERFGLIRFGSQVDVLLPPHTTLLVTKGDRVKGGKTVLAKWNP